MQFLEFESSGQPPPRLPFSMGVLWESKLVGVFGEGKLRRPENERWEGAPERLIVAFNQITNLKMCWKIVEDILGPREINQFTDQ